MDVSEYLLMSKFQGLHKGTLGKNALHQESRKEQLEQDRKSTRQNLMLAKRNVDENMSPFVENTTEKKIKQERSTSKIVKKKGVDDTSSRRREMLNKWKQDKQKRMQEINKAKKPIFKVSHVNTPIFLENLVEINKKIKGQSISKKKESIPLNKYNFAPEGYKFKAPYNVKPIEMSNVDRKPKNISCVNKKVTIIEEEKTPNKRIATYKKTPAKPKNVNIDTYNDNTKYKKTPAKPKKVNISTYDDIENGLTSKVSKSSKVTKNENDSINRKNGQKRRRKSQDENLIPRKSRRLANLDPQENPRKTPAGKPKRIPKKSVKMLTPGNFETTVVSMKSVKVSCHNSSRGFEISACYPNEFLDSSLESPIKTEIKTPQTLTPKNNTTVYISPFVTISRGKSSARKEFQSRRSQGGLFDKSPELMKVTGPEAGAAYFHQILDAEISRIEELCNSWSKYKDEENPPEDACDMINVAIGQSQLLITKKFKQFRGLINNCLNGDSEIKITCTDLHGYWDTAYIQVENLNKRFENLDNLMKNNWEEILPGRKEENQAKKLVKRTKKPKAKATSSLKDLIKAQRQKALEKVSAPEDFVLVQSPVKSKPGTSKLVRRSSRKSFLDPVLTSSGRKRLSSPGLTMMKASMLARSAEKRFGDSSENTPAKSILKSQNGKSLNKKKSVLFRETGNFEVETHSTSILSPPDLMTFTPGDGGRRRSSRLSKMKLF